MSDNKYSGSNAVYLPNIQLFYLFYVSLVFVFPLAYAQNIIGLLTFLGPIVFYILAEFRGVMKVNSLKEKQLFIDCIIMFTVGVLSTLVSVLFIGIGVFMLFRVYKYVAPKRS